MQVAKFIILFIVYIALVMLWEEFKEKHPSPKRDYSDLTEAGLLIVLGIGTLVFWSVVIGFMLLIILSIAL